MLPEGCEDEGPYECGGDCYCDAELLCQGSCPVIYAEKVAKVLSYSTHLQQGEDLGQFVMDDITSEFRTFEMSNRLDKFDIAGF